MIRTAAIVSVLGGMAAAAGAQTFIAFANTTMYRFELNANVETFTMGARMMSLANAPDGSIVGHSPDRLNGNNRESYQLVNPFSANPMLSLISDAVPGQRPTLSFTDDAAYSTREDANDQTELITVDPNTLIDSGLVGNTGLGRGTNGSGYDPASDTLYVINRERDALFIADQTDGSVDLVGSLNVDYFNGGAEFFDGTLYAWLQLDGTDELVVGTIDTGTGAFTQLQSLGFAEPDVTTYMSLVVVPAPASAALLGLGGLVALRRRR